MANRSIGAFRNPQHILRMVVMTSIAALLSLAAAELLLLAFHPQQYMMPRYRPSPRYGIELPAGQEIVHGVFGRWEYRYSINEFGYRGDTVPISMAYSTPNIVVLGDSNTMGSGVNDGEEYPAVMDRHLAGRFNVVNLGVSGYGLTQQIRYFVEFGQLFDPDIVVIQFASNDPGDNLFDPVTRIENGELVFYPSNKVWTGLMEYLADSNIQRSQLYKLFRQKAWKARRIALIKDATEGLHETHSSAFYNQLLENFVRRLAGNDIKVFFIATNYSLHSFPLIASEVERLDQAGLIRHVRAEGWFKGVSDFSTPEGHIWGKKGHQIIGENLAQIILGDPSRHMARTRVSEFEAGRADSLF